MAYNNNVPQQQRQGASSATSLSNIASMQQQLNQMQQLFQQMAQTIGQVVPPPPPQPGIYANPPPTRSMFPSGPANNAAAAQMLQTLQNHPAIASQISHMVPGLGGMQAQNATQMVAMMQQSPQMMQAMLSQMQSNCNQITPNLSQPPLGFLPPSNVPPPPIAHPPPPNLPPPNVAPPNFFPSLNVPLVPHHVLPVTVHPPTNVPPPNFVDMSLPPPKILQSASQYQAPSSMGGPVTSWVGGSGWSGISCQNRGSNLGGQSASQSGKPSSISSSQACTSSSSHSSLSGNDSYNKHSSGRSGDRTSSPSRMSGRSDRRSPARRDERRNIRHDSPRERRPSGFDDTSRGRDRSDPRHPDYDSRSRSNSHHRSRDPDRDSRSRDASHNSRSSWDRNQGLRIYRDNSGRRGREDGYRGSYQDSDTYSRFQSNFQRSLTSSVKVESSSFPIKSEPKPYSNDRSSCSSSRNSSPGSSRFDGPMGLPFNRPYVEPSLFISPKREPPAREKPKQYQNQELPSRDGKRRRSVERGRSRVRSGGEDSATSFSSRRDRSESGDIHRNDQNISRSRQCGKPERRRSKQRQRNVSTDSSSSCSSLDEGWVNRTASKSGARKKGGSSKGDEDLDMDQFYGAFDEKVPHSGESTLLPDYIESTPAGRFLTRDPKTGNMVATASLTELEDRFEREVLLRARKAREGRTLYKYPERTARIACCNKGGCAHESEDDDTDESDLEDGEIREQSDDNDDGEAAAAAEKTAAEKTAAPKPKSHNAEVQAKLDHPERLHQFLCFNDKGETNTGPLCKCSRRARRFGVRHGLYAGETLLEKCRVDSSNVDRLYHYRISMSPLNNFKGSSNTIIPWDSRDYRFDGFSLLTHRNIDQMASFKSIFYNRYHTIKLVEEAIPTMFTVRTLDLVCDYLFKELLELLDITWVQKEFEDGCRQIHLMPRFTRSLPDNGMEVLAMPHVLRYLLENSRPVVEDTQLADVAAFSKKRWEEFVKSFQFSLVTIPGMRPSTLRVDNMDRAKQNSDIIAYPQILHYVTISDTLTVRANKRFVDLVRKKARLVKYFSKKVTPLTAADVENLKEINYEMMKLSKSKEGTIRREQLLELSCQGFFATGLKTDVTQWGLMMPKVVDYVRFVLSLGTLQANIGYRFRNPFYLQLSLSHASYMSGFSLNVDHTRNTLTNCGIRKLDFGRFPVHKELRVKKRGLKSLLEIMSLNYRQYTGPIYSNERLEFLGDAVLEFLTTVHLFYIFPKLEEGGLATYRTAIIKNEHLTFLSKHVGLQHYLLFSHGPDLCYSAQFDHSLANAFEAILGAIFLDGGLSEADKFLAKYLGKSLNFEEFEPVWTDLPLHPLQEQYPTTDRHLLEVSPALQSCLDFEKATGIQFDHISLLARAFTHTSMNYTYFAKGTNQTLEFLGDSVLQIVVSDYLFKKYPNHHEGHLTLLRSSLVNNTTQSRIFKDIGIEHYIFKTNEDKTLARPIKERADYVEALLGAIFVDQGMDMCKAFCKALFFPRLKETIETQNWNDPKSLLQQCCLELRDLNIKSEPNLPTYRLISQTGPTHLRTFRVAAYFKDERIGVGEARSIRKAQFEAAQNALDTNQAMFPMLLPGTNKLHCFGTYAEKMLRRGKDKRKAASHSSSEGHLFQEGAYLF